MKKLLRKIFGCAIVLGVLISSYIVIAQIMNTLGPNGLIKSFCVESLRKHDSTNKFGIGDVLEFRVECEQVNSYDLRIYQNSSLVFETGGGCYESHFELDVPLSPPAFSSGGLYTTVLDAHVHDSPILGVCFSDSLSYIFEVEGVETRLDLTGGYNSDWRNLHLSANLTDIDGYPIVDRIVSFSSQSDGRRKLTNGWFPLGWKAHDTQHAPPHSTATSQPPTRRG